MHAAIYARKSTEQDVSEDAKSVTRQIDNARAYALAKGWTVDDAHIYVDDGISGAEFARRPALQAMLKAAAAGHFARVVVSEQKSLGRDMVKTASLLQDLDEQCNVEAWAYMEDRILTRRDPMGQLLMSIHGYADQEERSRSSKRVTEAFIRYHQQGRVVGGRTFGYRNKHVYNGVDRDGNPKKSHTVREIVPEQAAVVRHIFEMYGNVGLGLKLIATTLTREGAPEPEHARRHGTDAVVGWTPSTVRTILVRESYRGVFHWFQTRKKNAYGRTKSTPIKRPKEDRVTYVDENLRIIDDALWNRVQSRLKDFEDKALRSETGRLSGRPPKHAHSNLLSGLAKCGLCGGGIVVHTHGKGRVAHAEYLCHRARTNGTCSNTLRIPVAELNEEILQALEARALTTEAIDHVILESERTEEADERATLDVEEKDIDRRMARLVAAIEAGAAIETLVAKLRALEARKKAIVEERLSLRPVPRLPEAVLNNHLDQWRRWLRGSVTQGRAVIQRIIDGRIVITPHVEAGQQCYGFEAATRFDKLFVGVRVVVPKNRRSFIEPGDVTGTETIGPSEYSGEEEYHRLLERAYARRLKRVGAPGGT